MLFSDFFLIKNLQAKTLNYIIIKKDSLFREFLGYFFSRLKGFLYKCCVLTGEAPKALTRISSKAALLWSFGIFAAHREPSWDNPTPLPVQWSHWVAFSFVFFKIISSHVSQSSGWSDESYAVFIVYIFVKYKRSSSSDKLHSRNSVLRKHILVTQPF